MKLHKIFAKPLIAAALLGVAGGAAFAQKAPAAGKSVAAIDQIKAALKITPAQESAWGSFVAIYNQQFKPSRTPSVQEFNGMNTPRRIELLKGLLAEETAFMNRRYDANVTLYNQLSEDQKKMFDEMTQTPVAPGKAAPKKK